MVGLLALIILYWLAGFSFFGALLTAVGIGAILGFVLVYTSCQASNETTTAASSSSSVTTSTAASDAPATQSGASTSTTAAAAVSGAAVAVASTTPSTAFAMQPSAPLAGEDELSSRKGEWKYEAEPAPVVKAAPTKVKAKAPAKAKVADKAPAKAKTTAKAPAKKAAGDTKPATLLSAARPEGKDDLKLISGVGPKLEQTLNDLGVYHYDQVAKWKKKDITWVDGNLRFKGRIERDDWMSQAKILAKGGETEFSRKKKT